MRWEHLDIPLIVSTIVLVIIGLIVIAGATSEDVVKQSLWIKQFVWFLIGLAIATVLLFIDYRVWVSKAYIIFAISIIILLITILWGHGVRGARSWIALPGLPLRIQPSELVKLTLIFCMAKFLASRNEAPIGFFHILVPLFLIILPVGLTMLQPDLGTAMVILAVGFVMIWFNGTPTYYLLLFISPILGLLGLLNHWGWMVAWILALSGLFIYSFRKGVSIWELGLFIFFNAVSYLQAPVLWQSLKPHQQKRLLVFINPNLDPAGASYNLRQSIIAIGSGGVTGKGFGQGTQSQLNFLPEYATDFIFSAMAEEWGFIGSVAFLALIGFVLYRGLEIAGVLENYTGTLVAVGIVAMFSVHIIINVGMSMGLMPITGIPLIFISYGGSSLVSCLIAVSILLNIKLHRFG
jgi:rod shape determining protein RodA